MLDNLILSRSVLESTSLGRSGPTRHSSDSAISRNKLTSVLFVCWANVCRSPAGTAVFKKYLEHRGLDSRDILIDSAGVESVDPHIVPSFAMRWAAFRRGYRLKQNARRVRRPELDSFDLVIAMDRRVFGALSTLHRSPKAKIKLLSEFLPCDAPLDVPDPMNRTKPVCDKVFEMLESACPAIASDLLTD